MHEHKWDPRDAAAKDSGDKANQGGSRFCSARSTGKPSLLFAAPAPGLSRAVLSAGHMWAVRPSHTTMRAADVLTNHRSASFLLESHSSFLDNSDQTND